MINKLIDKLHNSTYITLEVTPPHGNNFKDVSLKINDLGLHNHIDGFTTTDSPLAKLKLNSIIASYKLQEEFNLPSIATMSMRDKNKIALQSDLLGASVLGVNGILTLTGDSAKMSDQPHTKGVFESDSSMLLEMVNCLNSGIDYAGKPLKDSKIDMFGFSVVNSYAKNPKTLQKKMSKKISLGTSGIITQPVYDIENAKNMLELMNEAKNENKNEDSTLILGYFPIMKLRTAQFLSSHVPGINVPPSWVEKLRVAHEKGEDEEKKVGFELSKNLFDELKELHPKIHLMSANQFELARDIITL